LLKINSARHLPVLRRPLCELPVHEVFPVAGTMAISGQSAPHCLPVCAWIVTGTSAIQT